MTKFKVLLAVFVSAVLFVACNSKSDVPVPEDASIVIHFNGKSIQSKLSWEEIKSTPWFLNAFAEENDVVAKELLNNPENSGINLESDFYFFTTNSKDGGFGTITFPIADEKKFNDIIAKMGKDAEIEKAGSLSLIADNNGVASWSNSRFVGVFSMNSSMYDAFGGSKKAPKESLVSFAKNIHEGKFKSLGKNSKFADLLKENGDINFWTNSNSSLSALPAQVSMMANLEKLLKDNFSAGSISFENGKVVAKGKSYFNKELNAIYKKHNFKNFDVESVKKLNTDNIILMMAGHIPLQVIPDVIALIGADGIVNMLMAELGITMDDVVKAFSGDFLMALSDLKLNDFKSEPDAIFFGGAGIGDKTAYGKIMDFVNESTKESLKEATDKSNKKPVFAEKEGWTFMTNDSLAMNSYGTSQKDHAFLSKISGHPFGMWVDLAKIVSTINQKENEPVIAEIANLLSDAYLYGGDYKNNVSTMYGELNFTDKNTNSLKQFSNLISKIIEHEKKEKKESETVDVAKQL